MALSGLQKQVLSLYRQCLRTARVKQLQGGQQSDVIAKYCREQFLQNKKIDHKNVQLIEHLLRQGKRQLDLVNDSHVTNVHMR